MIYFNGTNIPASSHIYLALTEIKKVIFNVVQVWVRKNNNFPDALTPDHGSGVTGDPYAVGCSAHDTHTSYGGISVSSGAGFQGRIHPGTRTIVYSHHGSQQDGRGLDSLFVNANSGIYDADGVKVVSLGTGANNVSSYNDGSYWFKIGSSGSYYNHDNDWNAATVSCDISLNP